MKLRITSLTLRGSLRATGPQGAQGDPGTTTWEGITDKPTTFQPAAHTHAIGEVTGLTDALSGKAATTHSHAIADVTGLTDALAGKAAATHTHAIGDVSGLQTALNNRFWHPNKRSGGGFYNSLNVPSIASQATFSAGYTQYFPFFVFGETIITQLQLRVMTAATSGGTGIECGIYAAQANDIYPDVQICRAAYNNRLAAIQTATFSPVTIPAGLYYIAIRVEASCGLLVCSFTNIPAVLCNSLDTNANAWGYRSNEAYTTLPAVAPASMNTSTPTQPILIRYA